MADIHDQAMRWAQANAQDPRAQDIMAKAWAAKNPQDPRSAQIMAKISGQASPSNAQSRSSIQAPSEYAFAKGLPPEDNALPNVVGDPVDRLKTTAKAGVTAGLMLAAPEIEGPGLLNTASRALTNGGGVGLQKYLGNIIDQKQDPTEGVLKDTALGTMASAGVDAAKGFYGGAKNMYQTGKWAANPPAMQDTAIQAVGDATDKLRSSEAENLKKYLSGKTIDIDTSRIRGIHPEIDSILGKYATPYGEIPSNAKVSAEDANKIRSTLDQEMSYKKLGPFAQSAETAARDAQIKPLADQLRGQVHDLSPEVSDTFDQWSDNLNAARNLDKRAETAPLTVLTSPSIDRRALLQKVDDEVGTNLGRLGSQMNDAKNLSNATHNIQPLKALGALGSSGAKGLFYGATEGNALSDPRVLQSLFGLSNANSSGQ